MPHAASAPKPKVSPLLMGAAGLTLAATVWLALQPEEVPLEALGPKRVAAASPPVQGARPDPKTARALERRWPVLTQASGPERWPEARPQDLTPWGVLPPPPAPPKPKKVALSNEPPPPPPPPRAPAFPYTLMGRLDDGRAPMAMLSGPQKSLAVKAKDVIDGQWRVDAVTPQHLTLTWLPAGLKQTLSYSAP